MDRVEREVNQLFALVRDAASKMETTREALDVVKALQEELEILIESYRQDVEKEGGCEFN